MGEECVSERGSASSSGYTENLLCWLLVLRHYCEKGEWEADMVGKEEGRWREIGKVDRLKNNQEVKQDIKKERMIVIW